MLDSIRRFQRAFLAATTSAPSKRTFAPPLTPLRKEMKKPSLVEQGRHSKLVPEAGIEPARPFRVEGFSYRFGFRRQRERCSWSGARLHHSLAAVGARRLLSTPSLESFDPGLGSVLARMLAASRAFAEFDGLHLRGFPWRAQIASSPLCLPISPLGLTWFVAEPMLRLATLGLFQLYLSTDPYMTPSSQRAVGAICTKARETRAISSSAPTSPMRKRLDKGDFKSLVSTYFTIRAID